MAHRAIEVAWKLFTRTDWTTSRSMVADFGPPPHAMYADELSKYSDLDLVTRGDKILAEIIRKRRVASKHRSAVQAGLKKELAQRVRKASPAARRKAGVR